MAATTEITRERIAATEAVIRPYVRRTPLLRADLADFGLPPSPLTFKLEMLQHSGSFKARGAFANLLLREPPAAGVVAASGANHGVAIAYAAQRLGVPATIFLPDITSPAKVARIRGCGAELVPPRACQQVGSAQEHRGAFVERGRRPVCSGGHRRFDGSGGIGMVGVGQRAQRRRAPVRLHDVDPL